MSPEDPSTPSNEYIARTTLSEGDYEHYMALKECLQKQSLNSKDRYSTSFKQDILAISAFVNRSPDNIENRALLVGLFMGPGFMCVNIRQLTMLIGRCKSSINHSLQQLGYSSMKAKTRAQTILLSVLPSLYNNPLANRQWSVRVLMSVTIPPTPVHQQLPNVTIPLPILNKIDDDYDTLFPGPDIDDGLFYAGSEIW